MLSYSTRHLTASAGQSMTDRRGVGDRGSQGKGDMSGSAINQSRDRERGTGSATKRERNRDTEWDREEG